MSIDAYILTSTLISVIICPTFNSSRYNRVNSGIIMSKPAATRQFCNNRYRNVEIRDYGVIQSSNRSNESQVNQEHARGFSSINNGDTTTVQTNNNRKKKKKKKNKKRDSIKYKAVAKTRRTYDRAAKSKNATSHVSAATSGTVPQETIDNSREQNGKANEISKSCNFNIYVQNGKVSEIPNSQSCNVNVQNQSQVIRASKSTSFDELSKEEKTDPLFVAIIDDGYPNGEAMTNLRFQAIDRAIQIKIKNLNRGSFIPRFEYAYIKNKSVIVKCADEPSKHWILKYIARIHPWPTAKLKPASMDIIDKAYYGHIAGKTSLFLLNEESIITVLHRLQKQNPQLDMGSWNISTEKIFRTGSNGFLIHFGIPFSSLKVLESLKLKLFFGMTQVSMNVELLS